MNGIDVAKNHTMADILTPRAVRIMDLAIQGMAGSEIAKQLEMSAAGVSSIIHAPNFQHQLSIRRAQVEEKMADRIVRKDDEAMGVLKQHAKAAADKIVFTMENAQSQGLQFKAAQDMLDRVGPTKQHSINQQSVVVISDKDAAVIAESLNLDGETACQIK